VSSGAQPGHLAWPFLVYAGLVLVIVAGMFILSYVLGQRHRDKQTGEPYESGIVSTGSARLRISSLYYVVAMLFVVFDLETVFFIAWAVALREAGWLGFFGALVFLGILVAVLVYEIREGGFDYGLKGKDVLRKYREILRAGGEQ
jgi:NADH-quinone oxidoreductase subunit A